MEKIKYYLDLDNDFLLAYEKSTEFFVRFLKETGEWECCGISFSNFIHDYCFKEITSDEALEKSKGRLPEADYQEYVAMLNRNK